MQDVLERYGVAIVVGSAVTVGLLYLMQAVVSTDQVALNKAPDIRTMEIVRLLEDVEPIKKRQKEMPPPPPEEFPDLPESVLDPIEGGVWSPIFEVVTTAPERTDIGGEFVGDGEYLPIVKVNPKYPRQATQRGIEGWVIVQFTVTERGSVVDAFVHSSDPPGIFDRAAVNAALKFKYKPRVVDGKPIRVSGVKNRIVFELEDEL